MGMIQDKVAIVTGAGSGIGRAIAILFAKEGARVIAADLDEEGANETIRIADGECIFIKANVAKEEDNKMLVKEAVAKYGALHIAVNNAGVSGPLIETADYSLEDWNNVISVNLTGVFLGMKYQLPAMLEAGGGSIINMSSILGEVGFKTAAAYTAAKHGLNGLTKTAALEYSSRNIRINSIGPGFILTQMLENALDAETIKNLIVSYPIKRLGKPEEVAELTLFLASDKAKFITGAYIAIDGGYLAQ